MNEITHEPPHAIVEKSRMNLLLWFIPVAAAVLCAWYVCRDILFAGPKITIYFANVDGLQAQNSWLQYRGEKIGEVETLRLTADQQSVAVTAKLDSFAASLAREGAVFWIVRPELKPGAVSGLGTLVSGNYINLQPGNGARTNIFTGAAKEPIEPIQALEILLQSPKLGSLQPRSPIFYRDIQVGEVVSCRLGEDAREVVIHARIAQDYAPLVRLNSKFWNAGGINFHIGLFSGASISAESAQTLISGGISFATPTELAEAATNGTEFTLNEKSADDWLKWSPAIPLQSVPDAKLNKTPMPILGTK
jgi:paraquat-inducible protein B